VASELQRDRSVLGRPRKGAMVDPVGLQWTSAGTSGFVQAARAIPDKADPECCDGQAMLALGQSDTMSRRGSGCYGNRMWALRRMVARDRTAAFGPQEQTQG
jgi:hypothetical protein